MPQTFDCIYLFENQEIFVLEIKRADLPLTATKAETHQWLLVEKDTLNFTWLVLLALNFSCDFEERFFRQGYLSFDDKQAVYIQESSSVQNILKISEIEDLPEQLILAINQLLFEK